MDTIYRFSANTLSGAPLSLDAFRGQVLLIVNTASRCGFTPQYQGLQALYREYRDRGFAVLGFPCNQFGAQEPGDSRAIGEFCDTNYQIDFPMFEKIEVNGEGAHPLYVFIKAGAPGVLGSEAIKWNFTKFLIGRDGCVKQRYAPLAAPETLRGDIEALLAEPV